MLDLKKYVGYNNIVNTITALIDVIVIYRHTNSKDKEMKKILFIMACAVGFNLSAQKQSEQVFKTKYDALINEFSQEKKDLTNDNIEQFREQYIKLQEGMKEIEMFRYEVLTEGKIFTEKELKNLDKDNQVDELEKILKKYSDDLKLFLGKHHEYGISKKECLKTYSNIIQCIDRKDYKTAMMYWRELFQFFPKFKFSYSKGDLLIRNKIDKSEGDNKEAYIDSLILLYDQRIKFLGNDLNFGMGYSTGKKGSILYKYRKESALKEAYELLKTSIEIQQDNSMYNVVKDFFDAGTDMINKRKIEPEEYVINYILSISILKGSTEKFSSKIDKEKLTNKPNIKDIENWEKHITNNSKVSEYINKRFASTEPAKCEYLIPAFKDSFNEHKTDTVWLEKVSGILSWKGCTDDPFYRELIIQLFSLQPSAVSAGLIGALFLKERKYSDALEYYKYAYEEENDSNKKADYYYSAAVVSFAQNKLSNARSFALKAAGFKNNYGKPYLLIAKLYAASATSCFDDDFDKSAIYWAAVDKLEKAKSIDETVIEDADILINKYIQRYPKRNEIFMRGLYKGDAYKINCWILESTTVKIID